MLYDFELAGRRVRLWQRQGESYAHVLMKALGYAMFVGEYPGLEIESRVGLRYKPDLVARGPDGVAQTGDGARFRFWGECGMVTMRKVAWLLKHGGTERLALFKMDCSVPALVRELREAVAERYRKGERLVLINFVGDVSERAATRRVERVPPGWYTRTIV
jgi:hypothetical protein